VGVENLLAGVLEDKAQKPGQGPKIAVVDGSSIEPLPPTLEELKIK